LLLGNLGGGLEGVPAQLVDLGVVDPVRVRRQDRDVISRVADEGVDQQPLALRGDELLHATDHRLAGLDMAADAAHVGLDDGDGPGAVAGPRAAAVDPPVFWAGGPEPRRVARWRRAPPS